MCVDLVNAIKNLILCTASTLPRLCLANITASVPKTSLPWKETCCFFACQFASGRIVSCLTGFRFDAKGSVFGAVCLVASVEVQRGCWGFDIGLFSMVWQYCSRLGMFLGKSWIFDAFQKIKHELIFCVAAVKIWFQQGGGQSCIDIFSLHFQKNFWRWKTQKARKWVCIENPKAEHRMVAFCGTVFFTQKISSTNHCGNRIFCTTFDHHRTRQKRWESAWDSDQWVFNI